MPDAAYIDAMVHYRTMFATLAALGAGTPPALWKAELDQVTPDAFDAALATSASLEGGSASGVRNFPSIYKVRALHARRAELDPTYANPYTLPISEPMPPQRLGITVRLGY